MHVHDPAAIVNMMAQISLTESRNTSDNQTVFAQGSYLNFLIIEMEKPLVYTQVKQHGKGIVNAQKDLFPFTLLPALKWKLRMFQQ